MRHQKQAAKNTPLPPRGPTCNFGSGGLLCAACLSARAVEGGGVEVAAARDPRQDAPLQGRLQSWAVLGFGVMRNIRGGGAGGHRVFSSAVGARERPPL